jgi:phosphonate transport system substrate-binding protein
MTVRRELPQAFKDDLTAFHLALATAHPDIYNQVERGGGRGYARVRHEQFEPIIQMRRDEAAERRRRA